MLTLFHAIVYQPIYNALIFFYNVLPWHDFGIAIIITTLLVKAAMIPLSRHQIRSQQQLQKIQPHIKEIQQKYKNDKERQTRELMAFYKKNRVNPFSGCLPLIVQLIVLIAIYRILFNLSQAGLVVTGADLYSFVTNPGEVKHLFLGMVDLSMPSRTFAVLAALAQYYQTKMLIDTQRQKKETNQREDKESDTKAGSERKEPDFAAVMTKQMLYIGPALTLVIGFTFAAGLSLYWFISTIFMIGQQWYIKKTTPEENK
ncbi:MAG TPA: YidC/Oxa1 family membrane protein insertase [Patescibacteria group bacterium]|nr:YidC/Oxa1 family membrane protein insertase [Patescibacteria group bacterium]